ncbi:MAG: glycosyl hydrolase, partial [Daejeonella sp.]|nr:glycosyl hydrolase [Daejeonella sp.]
MSSYLIHFLKVSAFIITLIASQSCFAISDTSYVSTQKGTGRFQLFASGKAADIYVSESDYPGVVRAAKDLASDIELVSNTKPDLKINAAKFSNEIILIGTIGKNLLIDKLIRQGKLKVSGIAGKWETALTQIIENPMPGVSRALVIAGSDKRGTIYGIYDLSQQIGVSPWYWWADVPVKKQASLYVLPGKHSQGTPAVKYRGIFINDEAPALSGWAKDKFGGFNHQFYEKVFELILRLKGNYLWPAMWGSAFNDDDKLNPVKADEYGIVMGTSHHEPLVRAHDEWRRYGSGKWNYDQNEANLKKFWKDGIARMGNYENIVSVGMRGDGDEPMSEGTAIALLERIVADQRTIIKETTRKDPDQTPQLWALYKEVQDYYDKGMRVPDDITLLLCDDNWGNIRKLPKTTEKQRSGGYGIYYHYDYVGGPRNYKWLNTNPISKVWEQMNLAYNYGADRIWIVNVGDIKPMEFPTEFFLDYAWNPKKWPAERLQEYTQIWASKQFGSDFSKEIAEIISDYSRLNGRRKPELLEPGTYSLANYNEAETVVGEYNDLEEKARKIYDLVPSEYRDAYYQLVMHPVEACANLNELYVAAAKNRLYAEQGRASTNAFCSKVKLLFKRDSGITNFYNTKLANGKWNHMMDQTHIGYTYWQQPPVNKMPDVKEIEVPEKPNLGVAIEGSLLAWPKEKSTAMLPVFYNFLKSKHYIELFNKGIGKLDYKIEIPVSWLTLDSATESLETDKRLWLSVDWAKAPAGQTKVPVTIHSGETHITINAIIHNLAFADKKGFLEANGVVSIEAEHFTKAVKNSTIQWKVIPGYGRTLSGVMTAPVTAAATIPGGNSPHLEYQVNLSDTGSVQVQTYISPSIDFTNSGGLKFAISFDDEVPQIINLHADKSGKAWDKSVADNIFTIVS